MNAEMQAVSRTGSRKHPSSGKIKEKVLNLRNHFHRFTVQRVIYLRQSRLVYKVGSIIRSFVHSDWELETETFPASAVGSRIAGKITLGAGNRTSLLSGQG